MKWTDNVVTRILGRMLDFVVLNLLWVICSIPIVTIGASTTALYAVMLKIVRDEDGYIIRSYFEAFRVNLKKSTMIWLIQMVFALILAIDFRVAGMVQFTGSFLFFSILLILGILWFAMDIYLFALTARYENGIKATYRNSAIFTIARLPYTLLLVASLLVPVILTFWNSYTLFTGMTVWLLIGVSLVAWLQSMILRRVFDVFHQSEEEMQACV
jgi:uncharacterized membrane protein YesL